jgi:hypothetical protein
MIGIVAGYTITIALIIGSILTLGLFFRRYLRRSKGLKKDKRYDHMH